MKLPRFALKSTSATSSLLDSTVPPQPQSAMTFTPASTASAPASSKSVRFGRRWLWAIAIPLLVILIAAVALGYDYYRHVYGHTASTQTVTLTIPAGATTDQIITLLQDKKLLSRPLYFKLYLRLSNSPAIQAGDFSLIPGSSISQLAQDLSLAKRDQATLSFPEGWRREEMAEYIETQYAKGNISFTGKQFSDLALTPSPSVRQKLIGRLPTDASLQGFLFPDTYYLDKDATAQDLIDRMVENYLSKVTSAVQVKIAQQGLTEYQALILAAIVERESYSGTERPIIGHILLTRYRTNEILGTDATLQYALGYSATEKRWWRQAITVDDLELNSPYNTRRRTGLPPAPIANPGLEAMMAIAQPQDTPYLYYLHDSKGNVYYAKTLQEHNLNVAKYLQ